MGAQQPLVLVTGGAGFIGQVLARELCQRGYRVRALDALIPQIHKHAERSIAQFAGDVVVGDIRNPQAVAEAMAGTAAVVHLAAETGVGQSMYELDRYVSVNVDGTRNVLSQAARCEIPAVVASSRAVYGMGATECARHGRQTGERCCERAAPSPSREPDRLTPVSVYGETKVAAERIATEFAGCGLPVLVLRPQNVIGGGQALHNPYTGVLAAFAARLRSGLRPVVYGTGLQTRDFVSVHDVASTICWALGNVTSWPAHPVLNLGSGQRKTLRELADAACLAAGAPPEVEYAEISRPGDIEHACADRTEADAAGAPAPRVAFADCVREFIDFANREEPVDPRLWDCALDELSGRLSVAADTATDGS